VTSNGGCVHTVILVTCMIVNCCTAITAISESPSTGILSHSNEYQSIALVWNVSVDGSRWGVFADDTGSYVVGSDSAHGYSELLLSKFDADGNMLWKSKKSEMTWSEGLDVVSFADRIFVAGAKYGNLTDYSDTLVVQYDGHGKEIWTRQWNGGHDERARGIDHSGNDVYVTGEILDPSQEKGFLLKYAGDGSLKWSKIVQSGRTRLYKLAVDEGSIYLVGTGTMNVNGTAAVVFKYDSDGNQLWTREWEEASEGRGVCVSDGYVYLSGFKWESDYSKQDAFLLKYDIDGNLIWDKYWGTNQTRETVWGISCGYNRIYIVGGTNNSGSLNDDMFILQYNENGFLLTTMFWDGGIYDVGYDAATFGSDTYVVGDGGGFKLWKYTDPSAPSRPKVVDGSEEDAFVAHLVIAVGVTMSIATIGGTFWILRRRSRRKK